jgi:hypothetical protein
MQSSGSSDFSTYAQMAGKNFLVSLPVLLVWLAGLVWCVINWRKAPRAAVFALVGLVIFFFERFFYFVASAVINSYIGKWSPNNFLWAYFFLNFFNSLLSAAGFALLILAVWAQRKAAQTETLRT